VLGRAGKFEAVAMDAKWLLGRAGDSVIAVGCCVKWVGLIMQISRVGGAYCVWTYILLKRLCSDIHSIPTNVVYLPVNRPRNHHINIWLTDKDGNNLDLRGKTMPLRLNFKQI